MRRLLLAATILVGDLTGAALADLAGVRPTFSSAETGAIARNEILRSIVEQDPWLVKQILEALAKRSAPAASSADAANPDIGQTRNSEGSIEWAELIRRARAEKEARDREPPAATNRSSEGSIELIEMIRRAREAKDADPKK